MTQFSLTQKLASMAAGLLVFAVMMTPLAAQAARLVA